MRGEFREQDTGQTGLQEARRQERRLFQNGQDGQEGGAADQGFRQTGSEASQASRPRS
jgi:hypothetical protein